jgi:hypothetical protein
VRRDLIAAFKGLKMGIKDRVCAGELYFRAEVRDGQREE